MNITQHPIVRIDSWDDVDIREGGQGVTLSVRAGRFGEHRGVDLTLSLRAEVSRKLREALERQEEAEAARPEPFTAASAVGEGA